MPRASRPITVTLGEMHKRVEERLNSRCTNRLYSPWDANPRISSHTKIMIAPLTAEVVEHMQQAAARDIAPLLTHRVMDGRYAGQIARG